MFKKGVCSRVGGGSHRTTCSSQLAPSTIWIPGTDSGHRLDRKPPFLLSQLTGPPGHLLRSEVKVTIPKEKSYGPHRKCGNDSIVTQSARRNESESKAKQSPLSLKGRTGKGHRQGDREEANLANTGAGKYSP